MTDVLDGVAIVGMAETKVGKLPGRYAIDLQAAAGRAAVADAGLTKKTSERCSASPATPRRC